VVDSGQAAWSGRTTAAAQALLAPARSGSSS